MLRLWNEWEAQTGSDIADDSLSQHRASSGSRHTNTPPPWLWVLQGGPLEGQHQSPDDEDPWQRRRKSGGETHLPCWEELNRKSLVPVGTPARSQLPG